MNLISQSLQALLECLSPNSTPPVAEVLALPATAPTLVAPVTLWLQIPHSALPNAYNSACSGREQFLQSCLTYIYLSRDAFDSDALKIAWVLLYMKIRCASTYALNFHHPVPTHLAPALAPAAPAACPLPLEILMDVDAAQQLHIAPLLCQRCKKPGHFAWHCPLDLEVHYLSVAEQEELLLQLLAAKDAARAPSLDKLSLELTLEEANMSTSPPELEGDF
ncbi:hypothetical protein C0989_001011 [Termitomyces sp. Mn162]|nr:hypothetical protein C0989_001011 [Termitomyces sp. Mn162]